MAGGLAIVLGAKPKGEGAVSDEEAAPSSADTGKDDYKSIIADSAKAGDWEALASAVEGLVKSCMSSYGSTEKG